MNALDQLNQSLAEAATHMSLPDFVVARHGRNRYAVDPLCDDAIDILTCDEETLERRYNASPYDSPIGATMATSVLDAYGDDQEEWQ